MLTNEDVKKIQDNLNISIKNISESLSTIIRTDVKISDVNIFEIKLEDVIEKYGNPDDIRSCIQVEIFGKSEMGKNLLGHFMILMDNASAKNAIVLATEEQPNDLRQSVDFFRELGNITSGAVLSSISEFFDFEFSESLPDYSLDMLGACLDGVVCSIANKSENTLTFDFNIKTVNESVNMKILLLFYPEIYELLKFKKETK